MKVLVTGGAGYIGSVVAAQLVAGGHDVVVYDSLVKGHEDAVPVGARFVKGDLIDAALLTQTLVGMDAVVHMAAYSLVGESVVEPAKYYQNNVTAGLVLLDCMRKSAVSSLVFSSTAAVYGEPVKQPIEEHDPTTPTNPYGQTKLAFEEALAWYGGAYGLRSISLRYFNAAGATDTHGEDHDPETHLIPLVLQAASGRRPFITVFGDDYPTKDGTCIRDYIHVVDLARAHVMALVALHEKRIERASYNLGCGGDGYSVADVIACARKVTGKDIPVKQGARRPGDPARLVASSARIQKELGWQAERQSLEDIVSSAWRFLQKHPQGHGH